MVTTDPVFVPQGNTLYSTVQHNRNNGLGHVDIHDYKTGENVCSNMSSLSHIA